MRRFQTFTILLLSNVPFINPFTRSFDLLTSFKDKYRPIDLSKERTNQLVFSYGTFFINFFFFPVFLSLWPFVLFFAYTRRKEGEKKEGGQIRTCYVTIFTLFFFFFLSQKRSEKGKKKGNKSIYQGGKYFFRTNIKRENIRQFRK